MLDKNIAGKKILKIALKYHHRNNNIDNDQFKYNTNIIYCSLKKMILKMII